MIPIADPQTDEREMERIEEVIESGMLADGPEVREFEDEFAEFCDTQNAVATANGTTALHAALHALGIEEGDKVLTTPFSFIASANAVRFCGAEPVFADIDRDTYNLSPDSVRDVISEGSVDALLVVHLYGLPANLEGLAEVANEHDIPLIEDASQAHGAEHEGRRIGSVGDVGTFSFYPTKNMTTGEGGMITTDSKEVAEEAARFVNHGRAEGYEHVSLGHNFRMSSVAAAIGRAQLEKLPEYTEKRQRNAELLTERLEESEVKTPTEPEGTKHVYHQYTVRYEDREGLRSHLDENGIGSAVYYPKCIHEQPAYSHVTHDAPAAERAAEEVLSLPVHPTVEKEDIEKIAEEVRSYTKVKA